MKAFLPFYFSIISILAGCSASLPEPTESDLEQLQRYDPQLSIQSLRQSRTLYIQKCSGCHSLYLPERYSVTEWRGIMRTMGPKAKLNSNEDEKILKYVTLYSVLKYRNFSDSSQNKVGMELETK